MIELNFTNNKKIAPAFEASYLGLIKFEDSIFLQNDLHALSLKNKCNYIVGLEHPSVISLGYRARLEQEIMPQNTLSVVRIKRGGLATIHSEGQLVIYPVLNLRELNLGAREYVMLLLQTTQHFLKNLKVESCIDQKSIGLYTKYGKIGFCGIQIKNGISQHGISLNVRNDLSLFKNIRSCGMTNSSFDSLSNHGVNYTLAELYTIWIKIFRVKFNGSI